jgi:hypothetical protein
MLFGLATGRDFGVAERPLPGIVRVALGLLLGGVPQSPVLMPECWHDLGSEPISPRDALPRCSIDGHAGWRQPIKI